MARLRYISFSSHLRNINNLLSGLTFHLIPCRLVGNRLRIGAYIDHKAIMHEFLPRKNFHTKFQGTQVLQEPRKIQNIFM